MIEIVLFLVALFFLVRFLGAAGVLIACALLFVAVPVGAALALFGSKAYPALAACAIAILITVLGGKTKG